MTAFDTAERLAIVEEWQRQAAGWKPKEGYGAGCLMMLVAVVLLVAVPQVGKVVAIPPVAKYLSLALIPILGIGGAGTAHGYLQAVEQVLKDELRIAPVFTT